MGRHREALAGTSRFAGTFRTGRVKIHKCKHQPPEPRLVAGLVEEMCDYVSDNWDTKPTVHLVAYVLRRLNWIASADGNGRTSRIIRLDSQFWLHPT
jgi:Fic family protein